MNVVLDEGCIGCGFCADICPEMFELNDDGFSRIHTHYTEMDEELLKKLEKAIDHCPILGIIKTE